MTKPTSPLRQRMIDDMTMRNLSPSTQETYIRAVAQFSTFHRRSPDKLGVEHLREYHLHQRYSIATFSSSTKPASFSPWRNARRRFATVSGDVLLRME